MKFKIVLTSATALCAMMTGAALADGNQATADQLGDGNSALVTQNGGDGNTTWLRQGYMHGGVTLRGGYGNSATITQDGDNNQAGSASNRVLQWGLENELTIWQRGDSNSVGLTANGFEQGNSSGQTNRGRAIATVNQYTSGNVLGRAVQQNAQSGDSGTTSNILTLNQGSAADAASNASNNIVSFITQIRYAGGTENTVTVFQDGGAGAGDNRIGSGFSGLGAHNHGVRQYGTSNNIEVDQIGYGNRIRLIVQAGQDAQSGGGWSTGSNNTADVLQSGTGNIIDSIRQYGSNNDAFVTQLGIENQASVLQQGSTNYTSVFQDGSYNNAVASITGNDNGGGTLAGIAGTLAGQVNTLTGGAYASLTSGQIVQDGLNNSASLTITSSNNNQFAYLQLGNNNTITGTITGSGSNSATHVQVGNSNTSSFSQNGGGNQVSVNQ